MKRRRGIFLGIALLAALAVAAGLLVFSPGFQTRLLRRALADQPGFTASLDRVQVGWGSVRIDELVLHRGAVSLHAPRVEARLPVWRLLADEVRLTRLVAHDWELRFDPALAAAAPVVRIDDTADAASAGWLAPFAALAEVLATADGESAARGLSGLIDALSLPVDLAIEQVDLRGAATWRNAGPGADGHATVAIEGGGLRAGQTGNFTVVIDAEAERSSTAVLRSLLIDARVELTLENAHTLDRVGLDADLAGNREDHEQTERFGLQVDLQVVEGSPRAAFALSDEHQRLINLELHRDETGDGLAGTWSTALNDVSLGSLMLGRALPRFTVEGQGSLSASRDLASGAIDGELSYAGSEFAVLRAELHGVGPLTGRLAFGAELRDTGLRCTRLDFGLNGAGPVMAVRLLQGVEVAHETREIRVARPQEPVFAVQLLGMPPAWAQPWIEPFVIDARPIQGAFVGLISPHGLRLVTSEELSVRGLVAAREGRTLLEAVDLSLQAGAEITADGWQVELDRLDLSDNVGPLATLSARGGRLTRENDVIKLAGRFEADLRGLERVPPLAQNLTLETGRLEGEFGVGVEDRISLALILTASGLSLADGGLLPEMQFDGRIDLRDSGAIEAHLPMRFTREERVSDLTLNLSATPASTGWLAEGSLSGPRAFVGDLSTLGLVLVPASATNGPVGPARSAAGAGSQPVWRGWSGTFKSAIGELTLPNGLVLENLRGDLLLEPARLSLSGLSAGLADGGAVRIDGGLGFDPLRERTYAAQVQVVAEEIDIGAVLRSLDPSSLPVLDGRLNVSADFESAAGDLSELMAQAALNARVTSSGGILRALRGEFAQYVEAGRAVAAMGNLVSALRGRAGSGRSIERLQDATQVAEQLSALPFDQLNLEVSRSPGGDYLMRDIAVISPAVRLLGSGAIRYDGSASIWQSPLALTLQLSAREDMAERLGRLGLLQTEADALGYRPLLETFRVEGTLVDLGAQGLWTLLGRALR